MTYIDNNHSFKPIYDITPDKEYDYLPIIGWEIV